jgi:hypothetical protein
MDGLCNTRFDVARLLPAYQRLALGWVFRQAQKLMSGCAKATCPTLLADRIVQTLCTLYEPNLPTSNIFCHTTMGASMPDGDSAADGDDGDDGNAAPAAKRPRGISDCKWIYHHHQQQQQQQQQQQRHLHRNLSRSSYRLLPAVVCAVRRRFERELFPVYHIQNGWRHVVPYATRRCA